MNLMKPFRFLTTIVLAGALFSAMPASSQIDSSNLGWKIGINTGFFLPSNHSAAFYNGMDHNENNINFVLKNTYQYNEIFALLEASDTFRLADLPSRMRYTPKLMVGFVFRNNFRDDKAYYIQFNQVKLRAADAFTLEVDPKPNIATDPDYRTFSIVGEENRFVFDVGYSQEFSLPSPMFRPYFDGGFTLTNTKVKSHKVRIEGREFSLINIYGNQPYIPNSNMQTFDVEQGGLGYGVSFTGGIKLYVNNYVSLDPSIQLTMASVNLTGYNQIRPHLFFNIRLMINNLFLFQQHQMGGDTR
jgi:hypothetical protein